MFCTESWYEYLEEGLRLYGHYDDAEEYADKMTLNAYPNIEPFELPSIDGSCFSHRAKVFSDK